MRGTGELEDWRVRVGDYRVIYRVDDATREVLVLAVGHRGGVSTGDEPSTTAWAWAEHRPLSSNRALYFREFDLETELGSASSRPRTVLISRLLIVRMHIVEHYTTVLFEGMPS
jgi:hypothetical protein